MTIVGKSKALRIRALEEALRATRAELQAVTDMHEKTSEEYRSINEELQALNTELGSENASLAQIANDIHNLLDSTRIAVVFLDKRLRIRHFTPAMTELFRLNHSDRGRPIADISPLVDYPQLAEDAERVLRERDVIERILGGIDGHARFLLRIRPYLTADSMVDGLVLTFVDVTHSQQENTEHARLAAIVNSSRDAIFGFSPDDRIVSWNPAAERIFGLPAAQAIGQPLQMLQPQDASPEAETFFNNGKREQQCPIFEMSWVRPNGQSVPLEVNYSPVRDDQGNMIAGKIIARDITERRQSERHNEMMLGELNHRVKNTLASVQAIAVQTLASTHSLSEFRTVFVERLLALSKTHNLLASEAWQGANLASILDNELAPYRHEGRQCATLTGDDLKLDSKAALALAMAIHELATNAGKYGALSVREGQVEVTWKIRQHDTRPWLHMVWTERGGPSVKRPTRQGFGTRLITDGIVYELGGEVKLDYPSTGVICIFDVPLALKE
ncbi:MAG TPA: PAS domain-containing protein [Oleiagrimonas sp.]|nr:PAS domain-containing protein [Oleiagrimonas sp.]